MSNPTGLDIISVDDVKDVANLLQFEIVEKFHRLLEPYFRRNLSKSVALILGYIRENQYQQRLHYLIRREDTVIVLWRLGHIERIDHF